MKLSATRRLLIAISIICVLALDHVSAAAQHMVTIAICVFVVALLLDIAKENESQSDTASSALREAKQQATTQNQTNEPTPPPAVVWYANGGKDWARDFEALSSQLQEVGTMWNEQREVLQRIQQTTQLIHALRKPAANVTRATHTIWTEAVMESQGSQSTEANAISGYKN